MSDRREVKVKETNVVAVEKNFFKLRLPPMDDRAQRLLRMIIAKIDDRGDKKIPWLVFDLTEVFELLGIPNDDHRWTKVRNALSDLRRAEVVIPPEYFKPGMWDEALQEYLGNDEEIHEHTGFIRSFRTYRKRNKFAVLLEKTMVPFLLDVKNFQKYRLSEILDFRRDYTIRFYEWFVAAKNPKSTTPSGRWYYNISIHELRRRLDLDHANGRPKKYAQWRDLRRWVIEPSCDEISRKSQFLVHFEPIIRKGSRAVSSIVFHLEPKAPTKRAKVSKAAPESERGKTQQHYEMLWHIYGQHAKDDDLCAKFKTAEGEMLNKVLGTLSVEMAKEVARNAGLDAIEADLLSLARKSAP